MVRRSPEQERTMPFIKVTPVQDRISFVNVDDIQSIAMGGPEDTNEGPCFVLTFRNGQSLVCHGEAEDVRRKIAAVEK
jgi:uncharacterized protein YlzI (FlbEa/FlbD family)